MSRPTISGDTAGTRSLRATERDITLEAGPVQLAGILGVPRTARGVVLFAHGSGSGRLSSRNNAVAHVLQDAGLATLLIDLLTDEEATDRRNVFDIGLLAERVIAGVRWLHDESDTAALPAGLFGASTGAAAALVAAARLGSDIRSVVSRGGRPDLAGDYLRRVTCPTLLIVGGDDFAVIPLNEEALARLGGPKELTIVPGATHLFEEPGALEEVSRLAWDWFIRTLAAG